MRLIDADALQKSLATMWYESPISVTGLSVSKLIDEQATIEAEPVKVVRCRDCRWWAAEYGEDGGNYGKCTMWGGACEDKVTGEMYFCADGEEAGR